jgi:hypothetical protein
MRHTTTVVVRRPGRGTAYDPGRMAVETSGRRPERVGPGSVQCVAYVIKEELCRHVITGRPGRAESRLESRLESRSAWPAS